MYVVDIVFTRKIWEISIIYDDANSYNSDYMLYYTDKDNNQVITKC